MREDSLTRHFGIYRRPRDAYHWWWFHFLCSDLKISASEALTEAMRDWVEKKDPDRKHLPPGMEP